MNLITDRTLEDVRLGTSKGQYGPEDLNRVEQAVAELYALAMELGVTETPTIKTDWMAGGFFTPDTWPTEEQMRRYLDNVSNLCRLVEVAAFLPTTMAKLTWQGANQIEQALESVYTRIQAIIQALKFSGELFAGEETL